MTLLRWLTFLLEPPDCDSSSPSLDLFISSETSSCFIMALTLLRNSDYVVVSVFIDFLSTQKGMACFTI